jgi:hypothetical protein
MTVSETDKIRPSSLVAQREDHAAAPSGWIEYYGHYAPSALYPLFRYVNQTLVAWAMRKFKRFRHYKIQASQFLQRLAKECAGLFVHWQIGMTGTFA